MNIFYSSFKQLAFILFVLAINLNYCTSWFINNEKHRSDLAFKNPADLTLNSNGNNINKFNFKPVFSYVGCYNDRRDSRDIGEKDFSYITKFNKSMPTVELCVQLCAKEGYTVAGIQAL